MPLESGHSKSAFSHNVAAEINAGKPQKQAVAIAYSKERESKDEDTESDGDSMREIDQNGFVTVERNPIIRAGVFQYKGSQLPDADPAKIYNVYRPLDELTNPETLKSLELLPLVNEHEMLGERYNVSAEEKGVHGSTGQDILVAGNDILAPIKIFSRTLKALIESGKTALSLGYNCLFEKSSGEFEGMRYDYVQRNIRGNHLALVTQGRNGTVVLDQHFALDHFDLALDAEELKMADEKKEAEKTEEKKEFGLDDAHKWAKDNMPKYRELVKMMGEGDGESEDNDEEDGEMALDADTKEKEGDQKRAEDSKAKDSKAKDESEKEEKKEKAEDSEKKDAMDAADVKRIVSQTLSESRKAERLMIGERDNLVRQLTPHVGTFDHTAMDADDVAAYGVKKLGISAPKGQERGALVGFLAAAQKASGSGVGYAMDSAFNVASGKVSGKLAARIAKEQK